MSFAFAFARTAPPKSEFILILRTTSKIETLNRLVEVRRSNLPAFVKQHIPATTCKVFVDVEPPRLISLYYSDHSRRYRQVYPRMALSNLMERYGTINSSDNDLVENLRIEYAQASETIFKV